MNTVLAQPEIGSAMIAPVRIYGCLDYMMSLNGDPACQFFG